MNKSLECELCEDATIGGEPCPAHPVLDEHDPKSPCERCNKLKNCEPIPMHGYTMSLCQPCARAAAHVGETAS